MNTGDGSVRARAWNATQRPDASSYWSPVHWLRMRTVREEDGHNPDAITLAYDMLKLAPLKVPLRAPTEIHHTPRRGQAAMLLSERRANE